KVLRERSKRGIFSFTIDDLPFTNVVVQVTSKGKLQFYYPEDAPYEEIKEQTLRLLSEANQEHVRILRDKTKEAYESYKRSRLPYEQAIKHSTELLKGLPLLLLTIKEPQLLTNLDGLSDRLDPQFREIIILRDAVEEHFRTGYPKVYVKMKMLGEVARERGRLAEELKRFAKDVESDNLLDKIKSFLASSQPFNEIASATLMDLVDLYLLSESAVPKKHRQKISKLMENVPPDKADSIRKIGNEVKKFFLEIAKDFNFIAMQVKNGEPLRGHCRLCR
ncbi:MAG: hypothetical protein QXG97_06680, partial [Nitrososphaerota archaeon]